MKKLALAFIALTSLNANAAWNKTDSQWLKHDSGQSILMPSNSSNSTYLGVNNVNGNLSVGMVEMYSDFCKGETKYKPLDKKIGINYTNKIDVSWRCLSDGVAIFKATHEKDNKMMLSLLFEAENSGLDFVFHQASFTNLEGFNKLSKTLK